MARQPRFQIRLVVGRKARVDHHLNDDVLDTILDHAELAQTGRVAEGIDEREGVQTASIRQDDEVGPTAHDAAQPWQVPATAACGGLQASEITGSLTDDREGERL